MFRKYLLAATGMAAAVFGPWTCFTASEYWEKGRKAWAESSRGGAVAEAASDRSALTAAANSPLAVAEPVPPIIPLSAPLGPANAQGDVPIVGLPEALRFDVSPLWVMQRWPRVSSAVPELQLQGYRVALITGTSPADLTGSLTYYFNPAQQVQRIAFQGTTGDFSYLAQMLVGRYGLTRRLTNDPGLIVFEGVTPSGKPASVVRMRAASLVRADDRYHRYRVEMVLERPQS